MLHRALELALERASRVIDRHAEARLAEWPRELKAVGAVVGLRREDVDVRARLLGHGHPLLLERVVQDIDPARDTDPGRVRATHRPHEPVVAAAPGDGDLARLRERRVREVALEDRAGVVVEPSGEALVDLVGHTEPVEPVDDRGEMRLVRVEGGRLRGKQVPHPARGLVGGHGTLTIASGVRGGSAPSITAIVIA